MNNKNQLNSQNNVDTPHHIASLLVKIALFLDPDEVNVLFWLLHSILPS